LSADAATAARVIAAAEIGGVRLVEANAITRIRQGRDIRNKAELAARVQSDPKAEAYISISATFELRYRLPEGFGASSEELEAFARTNGVFNAWPYWREFLQAMTAIVLPLYRSTQARQALLGQTTDTAKGVAGRRRAQKGKEA
jgi:hypothetical protein